MSKFFAIFLLFFSCSNQIERHARSVVKLKYANGGGGSGFVVDVRGRNLMITNDHVCKTRKALDVWYQDTSITTAAVIATDPIVDLCLLKPEKDLLDPLFLGNRLSMWSFVRTIGYPFADLLTYTDGYVTTHHILDMGYFGKRDVVHTNLKIFPGTSGSPVFDENWRVVGVVEIYDSMTGNGEIIPVEVLNKFLEGK